MVALRKSKVSNRKKELQMPRGDKASYTDKQKRQVKRKRYPGPTFLGVCGAGKMPAHEQASF